MGTTFSSYSQVTAQFISSNILPFHALPIQTLHQKKSEIRPDTFLHLRIFVGQSHTWPD